MKAVQLTLNPEAYIESWFPTKVTCIDCNNGFIIESTDDLHIRSMKFAPFRKLVWVCPLCDKERLYTQGARELKTWQETQSFTKRHTPDEFFMMIVGLAFFAWMVYLIYMAVMN